MKKLLDNRLLVITCLVIPVYCLSIFIEKRISPDSGFDFKLWSPHYLLFAILIPIAILIPLRFFSSSRYSRFVFQREKALKTIIIMSTGLLLIFLLAWYAMSGVGKLMGRSLKLSEADDVAMSYIKNDSTVHKILGSIDSIEEISSSISSKNAKYNFTVHGSDSILNIEILLSRDQNWIVDTLITK